MNAITTLKQYLSDTIATGEPTSHGGLTLVSIFGGLKSPDHLLAQEAFEKGLLKIEEQGGGNVPTLIVHNLADLPVLLLDGEHLEGAMQNRIVNFTLLVGASSSLPIPVACVEQGRWHYEAREDFAPSKDFAGTRLRGLKGQYAAMSARAGTGRRVDQSAVWDHLAVLHEDVGSESETGAMSDAYEAHRDALSEIQESFKKPVEDQTGVVVCIGGRPIAMDCFDRPETLSALWTRLVSGYALDSFRAKSASVDESSVKEFIQGAVGAQATAHDAVGLGTDVVLTADTLVGGALAWEGGFPHVAVFATDEDSGTPGIRIDRRIASARQRRDHRIY